MKNVCQKRCECAVWFSVAGAALVAAGCGGGGQANSIDPGPGQNSNIGPVSFSYVGKPHSLVEGVGGMVSVIGQSGASITTLAYNPAPNLASTLLLFTRNVSGEQLYTMPAMGGTPNPVVRTSSSAFGTCSTNGLITFLSIEAGKFALEGIRPDSSNRHVILPSSNYTAPAISPDGSTIAYLDNTHGNIFTMPTAGGTPHEVYSGGLATGAIPVWSPYGTTIAFTARPAGGHLTVYTVPVAGGALTNVSPIYSATGDVSVSSWSPDGETLGCTYNPAPGSGGLNSVLMLSLTGGQSNVITNLTYQDEFPAISPDGRYVAFYRDNTGGATPGIYMEDATGVNPQLILPDPTGAGVSGGVDQLSWSPFPGKETFTGAGGTISGGPISGFLLAQNGNQFGSVLTFTTTTPSTATITGAATSGGSAQLFSLHGDAITNVSYANAYFGAHTSIALTSTPSVVVSVDGSTGQIGFVAPAKAGQAKAAAIVQGSNSVLNGSFAAIYDGTGKNVAPGGASTIVSDAKTGKLVSFR